MSIISKDLVITVHLLYYLVYIIIIIYSLASELRAPIDSRYAL